MFNTLLNYPSLSVFSIGIFMIAHTKRGLMTEWYMRKYGVSERKAYQKISWLLRHKRNKVRHKTTRGLIEDLKSEMNLK